MHQEEEDQEWKNGEDVVIVGGGKATGYLQWPRMTGLLFFVFRVVGSSVKSGSGGRIAEDQLKFQGIDQQEISGCQ